MRVRHKIPAIFTLSMVDMLCCALGCVILLWLLNAKQNNDLVEEQRQETAALLAGAASDRDKSDSLLSAARGEHEKLSARLRDLLADRERATALQARLQEQIRSLDDTRSALSTRLSEEQARARG